MSNARKFYKDKHQKSYSDNYIDKGPIQPVFSEEDLKKQIDHFFFFRAWSKPGNPCHPDWYERNSFYKK